MRYQVLVLRHFRVAPPLKPSPATTDVMSPELPPDIPNDVVENDAELSVPEYPGVSYVKTSVLNTVVPHSLPK